MHLRTIAALLAAGLAVAAAPGIEPGYTSEDGETVFVQSTAWFTPSAPTGVGNVDHETGAFRGWDDTGPTGPLGGGVDGVADPFDTLRPGRFPRPGLHRLEPGHHDLRRGSQGPE